MSRLGAVVVLVAFGLALVGCGPKNYLNENDKLRKQNMALKREIDELKEKLERQTGQLKNLETRLKGPAATQAEANTPIFSQITLGRYSGPIDTDGDDVHDKLRLYVQTLDQKGRMLPVAAKASVKLVHIPDEGEPRALVSKTYDADAFSDAYRSSFTGQHYTLETDLPAPVPEHIEQVTVKVTVSHLDSNVSFSKQQTYRLAR